MAKKKNAETMVEEPKTENVIDEQKPAVAEEVEPTYVYGIVSDCSKLNVRKKPSVKSEPITTVNAKTKLYVNADDSTKDWYKVTTLDGVDGFCMKKYITIEK